MTATTQATTPAATPAAPTPAAPTPAAPTPANGSGPVAGPAIVEGWWAGVSTDDTDLTGLAAEWNDLFARCPTATPFQSHAWLASWWRHYGAPGRLRLVLVRHDGRLVAAAPLMLRRRGWMAVLTPIGGALSDFTDILIDDRAGAEAGRLLISTLLRHPGWQALDFAEARPTSTVGRTLTPGWPGRRHDVAASLCLELPATPVERLVRELPGHARKTVRRRLNQLERLDVRIGAVPSADAGPAVQRLLELHARQWQGRGGNPEHQRARFASHLTDAVGAMIAAGQATLLEYRIADRLVASSLVVIGPELAGGYLYGADPELRERADVLTLLLSSTVELASERGCATMSMLRGAEPYKLRWRPREVVNRRVLLCRPGSVRGVTYAAGVRAGCGLRGFARDRLPWLRGVRDRAAAWRPTTPGGRRSR